MALPADVAISPARLVMVWSDCSTLSTEVARDCNVEMLLLYCVCAASVGEVIQRVLHRRRVVRRRLHAQAGGNLVLQLFIAGPSSWLNWFSIESV